MIIIVLYAIKVHYSELNCKIVVPYDQKKLVAAGFDWFQVIRMFKSEIDITKFPERPENSRISKKMEKDDYNCFCGEKDEIDEMVRCDYCDAWVHYKCAGVNDDIIEYMSKFRCDDCLKLVEVVKIGVSIDAVGKANASALAFASMIAFTKNGDTNPIFKTKSGIKSSVLPVIACAGKEKMLDEHLSKCLQQFANCNDKFIKIDNKHKFIDFDFGSAIWVMDRAAMPLETGAWSGRSEYRELFQVTLCCSHVF